MFESLYTLWETTFDRFYCPKTSLLYEFVTDGVSKAWDRLPGASDIKSAYPNPCGWGTGMEDSVMNGATALDALVSAHKIGVIGVKELAGHLTAGLLGCQCNDKNYGFVARSVSPYDGKSHYIESSRDQYTHFIYSLLRYYFSDLAEDGERDDIRRAVVAVAEKCRREVVPSNDYHMLREDGTVGKVNKMWGDIGAHEYMRLPMFYLAAFAVTGEVEYEKLYRIFRDTALEKSLGFDKDKSRLYCSLQMMCSLRAVYDYDSDESFRNKLLPLMKELAEYGERRAIANSTEFSKPERKAQVDYAFKPWKDMNMRDGGEFGGYRYLNPGQSELKENVAFYPTREVGEGAMLAAMCPGRAVSDELLAAVLQMADAIEAKKHSSVYSLLYMPCSYVLCLENRMTVKQETEKIMNLKERNRNLKDFFDRKSDGYDDVHIKFAVSKALLTKSMPDGVKKILDLGGGTGMELVPFFERFPDAEAVVIDLSENMLSQIGARPFADKVKCICGDFFEADFGSGYDAVISTSALHHFSERDKAKLYKKVFDALKDGGLFLNSDKFAETQAEQDEWMARWENEPDSMAHIDTPLTVENETKALKAAGFNEVSDSYIESDDYYLVAAAKK